MLTISLKAHWQVATIMLSECWLHNKQPPTRRQGIKIAKLSSADYSCTLLKITFVICMWTKGGFSPSEEFADRARVAFNTVRKRQPRDATGATLWVLRSKWNEPNSFLGAIPLERKEVHAGVPAWGAGERGWALASHFSLLNSARWKSNLNTLWQSQTVTLQGTSAISAIQATEWNRNKRDNIMDHILYLLSMAQISTSAQVFDFTVVPGAIWDSSPVPHEIMEGVGCAVHRPLSCCQCPKRRMCCLKCPLLLGGTAEQMEQCILVTSAVQTCKLHYPTKHAELPPAYFPASSLLSMELIHPSYRGH